MTLNYVQMKHALRAAADACTRAQVQVSGSETESTMRLRMVSTTHLAEVVVWSHGSVTATVGDLSSGEYICDGTSSLNEPVRTHTLMVNTFRHYGISWDDFVPSEP